MALPGLTGYAIPVSANAPSSRDYFYDRNAVPRYEVSPPFPLEVLLDITSFCNHACAFCANPDIGAKATVDHEVALRFLKEAHALGARRLGVFGTGESFLIKSLPDYIRAAKDIGYEYAYIKTNGSMAVPDKLHPVLDAGLDSLRFSIHAGTRATYAQVQGRDDFDKVLANLKDADAYRKARKLPVELAVSFVLTAKGAPELETLKKVAGAWVDRWDVQELNTQCGNVLENSAEGEVVFGGPRYDRERGLCKLPFSGISLTPEGFVSACIMDFYGSLIVGDYAKQGLKEIWDGEVYRNFRKRHLDGALKGLICDSCIHNRPSEHAPLIEKLSRRART